MMNYGSGFTVRRNCTGPWGGRMSGITRKTRAMRIMGMTRITGATKTGRTSEDREDDQGGVQVRKVFNIGVFSTTLA